MKWLAAVIEGLTKGVLGWGQKQAEKPPTIEDANTPKEIRDKLNQSVTDFKRVRDEDDGKRGHGERLGEVKPPDDGAH